MTDSELSGRLVYLTPHADFFLRESNPGFASTNIQLANRIGRVAKVFDWDSAEGRLLLKERGKVDKWRSKDPRDYKFVVSICYPDLSMEGKRGFFVDEVMPRYHPASKEPLFEELPPWMAEELSKSQSDHRSFSLVPGGPDKRKGKKRVSR